MKYRLGKLSPRLSTTRKTGGKTVSSVGFISSLQAKITTTPTMILRVALGHPIAANEKGAVAGTGKSTEY